MEKQAVNLSLPYGICRNVSFHLEPGECILLAGPNGSGKTTLLMSLAEEGTVPSSAALIPTGIPKIKGFTVQEFVRTGCYRESDWAGRLSAEMEKRLADSLELLGLKELKNRDISTLSDGEFQKACIAVGLTRNCKLLMLDEPTAFLDVDGRAMVLEALKKAAEESGICVVFTSHDLHVSLQYCHRVMAFTPDGRFLESGTGNRTDVLREAFPAAIIA